MYGRRDNMYKARIKILVKSLGVEEFRKQVEEDWEYGVNSPNKIDQSEINRIKKFFTEPDYKALS